jgi:hypothetical protein
LENIVLAFLLVVIMHFTIPSAIIQNPKKRKMIGPGNQIKVKPLVDTTPAIAIRAPVTISKSIPKVILCLGKQRMPLLLGLLLQSQKSFLLPLS